MAKRSLAKTILLGGLAGGALDLLFAVSFAGFNGVPPGRVFQVIASGVLGNAAFAGSAGIQALGIALHLAMSIGWAAGFAALALRWPGVVRHPWLAAVAFGLTVFLCMRLVVLPLSAYPRPVTFKPLASGLDLLSHMLLFAGPIVWATARYTRARQPARPTPLHGTA